MIGFLMETKERNKKHENFTGISAWINWRKNIGNKTNEV